MLIFFVISGYLVAQSWERDPNVLRFAARRILRIWPGLAVVTLLWALVLGPIVSSLPAGEYFASGKTWVYLKTLKLSVRYELPGVFENNPFPRAVNGSLWTIPIEVDWYIILLVVGLLGLLKRRLLILGGTVAFAIFVFGKGGDFWWEFGVFFCSGVCLNCFRDVWTSRPLLSCAVSGGVGAVLYALGFHYGALLLVLSFAVVWFGTSSFPVSRRFGRFGDISYGTYIYAFPTQQTIIWLTGNQLPLWAGLAVSMVCTVLLAFASWHLIEKPALALKRKLPQRGIFTWATANPDYKRLLPERVSLLFRQSKRRDQGDMNG